MMVWKKEIISVSIEMTQWLRVPTDLPKEKDSVTSTHIRWFITSYKSNSTPVSPSGLYGNLHACGKQKHTHTHTQTEKEGIIQS